MEAIILAGGLGSRLKEYVPVLPKPLAPVCGHPFLRLLFAQLQACQGIERIILAVGYKAHLIVEQCEKYPPSVPILFSFEASPLGTGGALRKAATFADSDDILVLNGDSYLEFPWPDFRNRFSLKKADMAIACREVKDPSRFGQVIIDPQTEKILRFEEKRGSQEAGWINGGVYLMKRALLFELPEGRPFSFEEEVIPPLLCEKHIFGYLCQGRFVDIGTKESYEEAQEILRSIACNIS